MRDLSCLVGCVKCSRLHKSNIDSWGPFLSHFAATWRIIIIILYPWVYSSQGLKAKMFKSKLEWLLVRNVVDRESVVQKNRVKTQKRHRQTLCLIICILLLLLFWCAESNCCYDIMQRQRLRHARVGLCLRDTTNSRPGHSFECLSVDVGTLRNWFARNTT